METTDLLHHDYPEDPTGDRGSQEGIVPHEPNENHEGNEGDKEGPLGLPANMLAGPKRLPVAAGRGHSDWA